MKLEWFRIYFIIILIFSFQACSVNESTIKSIAQTSSATQIEVHKKQILNLLIKYKNKLDLRNPYNYNPNIKEYIISQINESEDYVHIIKEKKKLNTYDEYLHFAFSEDKIKFRNDFLVVGIYKLIYKAFSMNKNHQFAAMQYNKENMLKLYEYLQVIRWKIRTTKNKEGEFLYKTWQNNWQLELTKVDNSDLNVIKTLTSIISNKENIYNHSNFSFEVIISQMLTNIELSLKMINVEPLEMSISALKSFAFII